MNESKNTLNTNPTNTSNLQNVNQIHSSCNKNDTQNNQQTFIQRTYPESNNAQKSEKHVSSLNQNVVDLSDQQSEKSKDKKDKIIKAMSQIINARNNNQPKNSSTQSIKNHQTHLKSLSPNSNSQNTSQQSMNKSKINSQNSVAGQTNLGTSLMPKVSSMNNLLKLCQKLSPQTILSEIKTRGYKDRISPIRYLLYFCIEKILYTLWKNNGIQLMSIKLKNPMQERKFICQEILKGVIQLLTYFHNLQRPFISKVIMSVFNRLGLPGIFNQSWLPNCVKANLSIFQKTKAKVQELLQAPKTKNITSNIFNNIQNHENLINYDHLGLELEDENQSSERIDEIDKGVIQNKLFFFKNKSNPSDISHHSNEKINKIQKKNTKKKSENFRKQVPSEQSQKEMGQNRVDQKEFIQTRKIKQSKFEISLQKTKVPENTFVFSHQNDEQGHLINKTLKKLSPQIQQIPQYKIDKELHSQKRQRPKYHYFITNQQQKQQTNQKINASKQQIQQMIQQLLFNSINQITQKIINKFQIRPTQLKQVLQQSVLNKVLPIKLQHNQNSIKQIKKSKLEQKPTKNKITVLPEEPKRKINFGNSQGQKKSHSVPLTDKQLIALVDKTSIQLSNKGCSQQEIINGLFKVLQQKNVDYEKKQEILEAWFESKEDESS